MCAKGCGIPIRVTDEEARLAAANNMPLTAEHDDCMGETKKAPEFRVVLSVFKCDGLDGSEELLTNIGATVPGSSFAEAFPAIDRELAKQWETVSEMKHIVDEE